MTNGLQVRTSPGTTRARNVFDRFFEDFFNESLSRLPSNEQAIAYEWSPRVDITESDDAYHFVVEAPGVKKEDLDISVDQNVLTVSGERKYEHEEKKENVHRVERAYGRFARSFTLPANVEAGKVDAEYKDGLLKIKAPKSEQAKPRKVSVK